MKLESLNIGGNNLTSSGLRNIFRLPIKKLDLCKIFEDVAFVSVDKMFPFENGSMLELNVSNCQLNDDTTWTIV